MAKRKRQFADDTTGATSSTARDPEWFTCDDLIAELKVQTIDVRARLAFVDALMQKYGTERESLYRYLNGVDTALGANVASGPGGVISTHF